MEFFELSIVALNFKQQKLVGYLTGVILTPGGKISDCPLTKARDTYGTLLVTADAYATLSVTVDANGTHLVVTDNKRSAICLKNIKTIQLYVRNNQLDQICEQQYTRS